MTESDKTLKETLKKVAQERGYENCQIIQKAMSTDGANYTSFLYLTTLQAPGKKDLKLFAKVAAASEKIRSITHVNMFQTENLFYNKFIKKYNQLEEVNNIPVEHRLLTPEFYGGSDEYLKETLILEDLTTKGYTTHDRFKSIDWEYASKSLENLAKLHALSIALSEYDPAGFEEMALLKGQRNISGLTGYFNNVITNAIQVTKKENRDRFSTFIRKIIDGRDFDRFYQYRKRPVIIHGDYRPSNLMHRIINGNMEVLSIDYQTLEMGNPIIDISYFIFIGSDKKFRNLYFKQSLEHYYEELCKALTRFGLAPEEMYSREDFEFELKEVLPVGLLLSVFCLLVVTVDKEDAPKMCEGFTIDDFAVKPNKLYAERLNDVIDDYIDMGLI